MATEAYRSFRFGRQTEELISLMNGIVEDYLKQGFTLTVRQLYYQLVARAVVENTERSYKRITGVVNDARLAGLMDWDAIEDRTRSFVRRTRWQSGAHILKAAADSYHIDMWANQVNRVFVIIEKEALVGVLDRVCRTLDVPLLAARGYPSGTVLREFAVQDVIPVVRHQDVTILHLGDHDPSGIDMTRDLTDRVSLFTRRPVELVRLALNMPQIEELSPPPNPAKVTDSRFQGYADKYGTESWELDALPPTYLETLVSEQVHMRIDADAWAASERKVRLTQAAIRKAAQGVD
jgi:hypothetical protein